LAHKPKIKIRDILFDKIIEIALKILVSIISISNTINLFRSKKTVRID